MHRAFWNILDEELKEVPPNYTQAMVLLADVKEVIHSTVCLWRFDIRCFLAYVTFCYTTTVSLFYLCKVGNLHGHTHLRHTTVGRTPLDE
jgi:hypothetical protein